MKKLIEIRDEYLAKLISSEFGSNERISSGIPALDKMSAGFFKGELIVLGGRPAMGKTAFSVTQAIALLEQDIPVLYYSLELSELKMLYRFIKQMGDHRLFAHPYTEFISDQKVFEMESEKHIEKLKAYPLYIVSNTSGKIQDFEKAVEEFRLIHPKRGFIIFDYLQLLHDRAYNRENEIASAIRKLKLIANETGYPIFVLSQLSRAVETRGGDKRPQLSDLRESGAIEQDADKILFLHRPEYYGFNQDCDGNSTAGLAEFIVAKNRTGSVGSFNLHFTDRTGSFSDPDVINKTNFRDMRKDEFDKESPF
jgi:replicative DNA helicase